MVWATVVRHARQARNCMWEIRQTLHSQIILKSTLMSATEQACSSVQVSKYKPPTHLSCSTGHPWIPAACAALVGTAPSQPAAVWQCMPKPKGNVPFDFHRCETHAQRHSMRLGTKLSVRSFVLIKEPSTCFWISMQIILGLKVKTFNIWLKKSPPEMQIWSAPFPFYCNY